MDGLNTEAIGPTPLGYLLLVCMVFLTWFLPRRAALIPLLLTTCYIPLGQTFVIAGAHFPFFRVLLLVGWFRVLSRKETQGFIFTKMDKVFVWWLAVTLIIGSFTQPSEFFSRFISCCGQVYTAAGTFFLVRCWLRSVDELVSLLRSLAWMIVPLTFAMVIENITDRNLFFVFGGVAEYAGIRDGAVRAQGAFRQPILAGTYGATLFPLFIGVFFQKDRSHWQVVLGLACSVTIALVAASSGAMLALLGAIVGLGLWRFRYSMRLIRRGSILIMILLALTMKAPVWYVFARLSEVVGGTGWYRSYLIEQAVNHFDQWCFTGSLYTANWAPAGETPPGNPNNTDIINQFVLEGLQGGLLKVALFVFLIVIGFKNVGRFTRIQVDLPFSYRVIVWSLGVCLFSHCLSFCSVTYFDQIIVMWYFLLAALAMLQIEYSTIQQVPTVDGVPA